MVWWICIICMNLLTFAVFGADKRAAVQGRWRVRESTLLLLCLLGGAAGGLLARHVFHHKTRKSRFAMGVPLMIAVQIVFLLTCTDLILK